MLPSAVSGVVAGYGVAIPVGAIGVLVVVTGAQRGLRVGASAAAGVAAVDAAYATLAVLLGAIVAPWVEPVRDPLRIGAAGVLALIGLRLVMSGWGSRRAERSVAAPASARRAFLTVVALTAANPATFLYFSALIGGSTMADIDRAPERLVFALAVGAASASWQLVLAGVGSSAGTVLTGPSGRRWTATAGGVVVIALAVKTLVA